MYKKDFENDLEQSQKAVDQFKLEMIRRYRNVREAFELDSTNIVDNNDYKYDVKINLPDKTSTFEVKDDDMASSTGNIAIEYHCRGKDSGVRVTTAQWWVQRYNDKFYILSVEKLKKLIEDKAYFMTVQGAGDPGSNTCLYLFKADKFTKECEIIL